MLRALVLGALFWLSACAAQRTRTILRDGDKVPMLVVGQAATGEVVVAANHYNSMNGMGVAAADVHASGDGRELLLCKREMLTGSHQAQWICRYPKEVEREGLLTRALLDAPSVCTVNCP